MPAAPVPLLAAGQYQAPLVVSPDLTRLAYLAYDPDRRSQTAGARQLANSVRLLDMAAANGDALLYQAETPIEHLAPALDWLGSNRLLVQRARLAGDDDAMADGRGPVERGEQEVQVDGERVHHHHLAGQGSDQPGGGSAKLSLIHISEPTRPY